METHGCLGFVISSELSAVTAFVGWDYTSKDTIGTAEARERDWA
jgi:hypothetical protein